MDKRNVKKPVKNQIGSPLRKTRSEGKKNDKNRCASSTAFGSWFSFKNIMSSGSRSDIDKAIDMLSSVFSVHNDDSDKSNKKSKSRTSKRTSHIIKIDLRRIDEDSTLSSGEKMRLKKILNRIKYEEPSEHTRRKCVKRGKGKPMVVNKSNKTHAVRTNSERRERRRRRESDCPVCKRSRKTRSGVSGERRPSESERKFPLAKLSASEERMFQALINVDRSCCDPFRKMVDRKTYPGGKGQGKGINIENIEVKYINPTCIIQCNTAGTTTEKKFSEIAFGSHFGLTPSPLREERECKADKHKAMHFDSDFENGPRVAQPQIHLSDTEIDQVSVKQYKKPPSERCELGRTRSNDAVNVLTEGGLQDGATRSTGKSREANKRASRCRKFKSFVKRFFCLGCAEVESEADVVEQLNSPKIKVFRVKEKTNLRKRMNSPDVKVVRTTEQEFNKT